MRNNRRKNLIIPQNYFNNKKITMENKQKELSITMWTDTKKLATWKKDIWETIKNDGTKILNKNQIPLNMDKREKELAKKRSHEN